jgi:hypothetical protein
MAVDSEYNPCHEKEFDVCLFKMSIRIVKAEYMYYEGALLVKFLPLWVAGRPK